MEMDNLKILSVLGYFLIALPLLQFPIWAVYEMINRQENTLLEVSSNQVPNSIETSVKTYASLLQKIMASFKPNEHWGPKDSNIKEEWLDECRQRSNGFWKTNFDWPKSKVKTEELSAEENIALKNQDHV